MKKSANEKKEKWYTFTPDKADEPVRYTIRDFVAVSVITLIAAVLAFTNLGDRVAPQTFWSPERGGYAVIEFQREAAVHEIMFYLGSVHIDFHDPNQSVEFAFSDDGVTWGNPHTFGSGDVFAWNTNSVAHTTDKTGRFVMVTANHDRLRLGQVGFKDAGGNLIPIRSVVSSDTADFSFLTDKQQMVPDRRSFMNSTYFDEIYHPRTAYEFVNGLPVYETTHPQLGKLIMAFFVNIFGMTPFGWRFAGALFGVLMVPLLFMFARDMFRHTFWASFAAVLFTFDFMRFTQTRLATIDTFIVFFTVAMFYCMYKYYRMTFYETDFHKTLVPLFFSGLFMGLGIASKWQGVYAGMGLAVVFAVIMVKRYAEHDASTRRFNRLHGNYGDFVDNAWKTCLWCVLFFVIIPLTVYIASFIPYHLNGNEFNIGVDHSSDTPIGFFRDVWESQKYMYWYHGVYVTELQAHTFSSSWWQWILNLRPVFYYSDRTGELHRGISAFGNPVIWWGGFAAAVYCSVKFFQKYNKTTLFLLIGYLSMLLPWILVPRMAWMYHYFPSTPFIILFIVHAAKTIWKTDDDDGAPARSAVAAAAAYTVTAALLFALFYPVLAGTPVNPDFVKTYLQWFNSWILI